MKSLMNLVLVAGLMLLVGCPGDDTISPTVSFIYPLNGASLDTGAVIIKVVAQDNKVVIKVEFYADAVKFAEAGSGNADTFAVSWNATAGSHTLKAVAWDGAENKAEHSISVNVVPGGGGGGGSGPTEHSEDIVGGDSIWYPSGNPHIVKRAIEIFDNGRLTIMPGCTVKFYDNTGIGVGQSSTGTLIAQGKADSIIAFLPYSNAPTPGIWFGISFMEYTGAGSRLDYCHIDYAGAPDQGAVDLSWGATVAINNCIIRKSGGYGIAAEDHDGNATGLSNNTIINCTQYPLFLTLNNAGTIGTGNTLVPNDKHGILVDYGQFTSNITWANHGVPYVLRGSEYKVWHENSPILTIASGCTLKLQTGTNITVGNTYPGGLVANNVVFTSSAGTPQRGDWDCIFFGHASRDADCRLTNCTIEFGGEQGFGNIFIEDALPTITGCHIAHSAAYGIYLEGTEFPSPGSLRANNTFDDNASGDIREP